MHSAHLKLNTNLFKKFANVSLRPAIISCKLNNKNKKWKDDIKVILCLIDVVTDEWYRK